MDFAQSADGALKLISDAAGASLILILSDINMPGMTGLELLPKAKAARPDVPVIMITAYGDDSTRRKALEGGAEALLTKPIDFVALRGEIDNRWEGAEPRSIRRSGRRRLKLRPLLSVFPRKLTCHGRSACLKGANNKNRVFSILIANGRAGLFGHSGTRLAAILLGIARGLRRR